MSGLSTQNKPDILIFSPPPDFSFLGIIRDYESLALTRRFYAAGEFELHINIAKQHTDKLVRNNILAFGDGRKAGIIRHREPQQDQNDLSDTLTIKGPTLQGLAHDRIILPADSPGTGYDAASGTQETILKHFVTAHMAAPSDTDRAMAALVVATDQGRGASDAWRFNINTFVDDALNQVGTYAKLGWDIRADIANKQLVFDVYQCTDRSMSQSAVPPVMFAGDWSNISQPHLIQSWIGAATAGYAVAGDDLSNLVQKVGSASGYERQEQTFDCSDASTTAELLSTGAQKLGDVAPTMSFSFDILPDRPFVYGRDYDLGDIVTAYSKRWGVTMDAQITEMVETYEASGNTLTPTFGTNIPTLKTWIRKQIKG